MSEVSGLPINRNPLSPGIPALRSGPRGLFDLLPLSVVLPAAAAGAAAGTTAVALHAELWVSLAIGFGIALLGTIKIKQTNIWQTLGMRIALRWRNRRGSAIQPAAAAFDVPVPESGGVHCGMRWDGRYMITMLEVGQATVAPTLLGPAQIRTDDAVPLTEAARCLSQFDIRLAAIDVVTQGVRTQGDQEVVRIYEQLLGPLPASAARTVRLALRFDPLDNTEAIDNRGGGDEGTIRTALVATRRVVSRLATDGVRVRMLTAAELTAADADALYDTAPQDWTEQWHTVRNDAVEMSGYTVRSGRLTSELLAGIWAVPGLSTLVRLRLTPVARSAAPGRTADEVAVTALVRHDTNATAQGDRPEMPAELGLRRLTGRQRRILLDGGHIDPATASSGPPAALARLAVPAAGSGQVIGATSDGFGVAVPLFGPAVRRVEIVGQLRLTQLMVLRAIAVGAKVIVHSTRPDAWSHLAAEVGEPTALSVSSPGGGAQHAAAATMIVYDGVGSAGQVAEATVVHVRAPGEVSAAVPGADVVLVESATDPHEVTIRTARGVLTVRAVTIPEESRYLDAAPDSVPQPA
ncbi:type VII secretion protein EccE [Nocardia sp. NPDC046473]|uniref:type VII secretion protein EccE n=1 Tax=Nocardia sp. NPDC046473 TaxID=3155733 RepID=UPI0033E2F09B